MASKDEGGETELAAKLEHHQELGWHDDATQGHDQSGNYEVISGTRGSGGSSSNENKWNKNGFGQDEATRPMRTGTYTKEETATIIEAVKQYCAMKQITVARLCSECDHKADLKGSWMEIAKCLPNRPVQSVYRHGLRQLHPFKRGVWSDEEVEMLISLVVQVGKKWAHIQAKLNRSADSCRDKYREVDDSFIRGRWKENETEQLKRLIREYLRVDPTADIKEVGKMVIAEEIKIPWSVISKRMGKRSRLSCFKKWQKMTGLLSPCDMIRLGVSTNSTRNVDHLHPNSQLTTNKMPPMVETIDHSPDIKTQQQSDGMTTLPSGHPRSSNIGTAAAEGKIAITITEETGDIDIYLLSELVSLDICKTSDICWDDLRVENAQERWYELLEEWQSSIMDDSLLALPLSEIAQHILERKTNAQRAAETVEAVDLPNPLWNHN